ncbi:AfsR/SARP family transcriptional regulator [Lentzea nigeriaca]|uniref:AfsR/SARP family transcriptional regulator n=1 Tax=Lentzea nigeriaca TaxID=1128665 RepID=UPI0027DB1415|nr:BTAD domain-containing putative transcriptional regulator [Lentzea nigeriaca]MBM7858616.1 DNA-binding SARP family transcriptional activator/DNA-binding transcriptional ArsR family regulator [Lentzea nigeriaca]
MAIELRVLGQVELRIDGRLVEVGHARQRCVLAVLLVEANRVVTVEQLLDRVWGDRLPYKARRVASNYASRLRRVLAGEASIVRQGGGYVLRVDPEVVDLHRFRMLVEQARGSDDERALALLEEAAGLWRGEAFEGLDTPWITAVREGLARERFAVDVDRVDLALARGRHAELCAELAERADAHPLDERVAGQLMLALYRNGRQAEAFLRFESIRARLADEVGADPGPELRELHRRILDTDPVLGPTAMVDAPQQLPAPPVFTGRAAELMLLDETLAATAGPVLISAIGGTGGIGKTWLALAWAHRHLDRFPDGQLFVDLHGFSPTQEPMAPAVAVRGFLDALGVDPGRVPADLDAQAALYRSLVAGKRILVMLDNAATAEQVVPLLPGSPTCTVLVTGRALLPSLIDRHGARHLRLDVLDRAEASALLAARLGANRVAAEPDAVDDLVELCGGHPLALSITARDAATRPGLPLAEVAAELRELGLEMLDHGSDPAASLPAVLSWSLRRLTDEHRTVFGLLGIAPGPDISLPAAISLTDLPPARARKALSALEEASLLERRPGGRYVMHDLVRAYAATTVDDLPADVWKTALTRVMDFHLHTALAAARLLEPHRQLLQPGSPAPDVHPLPLPDSAAAMAWMQAEHPTLLATQRAAVAHGRHHVVWHLAQALDALHFRRGRLRDAVTTWQAALDAAVHLPDPATRIRAHRLLGRAHAQLGQHEESSRHLDQALALAVRDHNAVEQAYTHLVLASAGEQRGDYRQALDHARHALALLRTLGLPVWEAVALNAVGWLAARLGDFDTARDQCHAALVLYRRHHDRGGEAATLDSLGFIADHTGDHRRAVDHYHQALALLRTLGHTYDVADTLDKLGHAHSALGQPDQARAAWKEALELYREQGRSTDAERVHQQLDAPVAPER